MIRFILNDQTIAADLPPGTPLLDLIRYRQQLPGTKIGCREGDCGACTILVGTIENNRLRYRSATSCLMPLGNAQGKHIVTIEGINGDGLTPVQQAMKDEGATQCGFCTPGFVMSLTGFCLDEQSTDCIASIDGNICRCTGYASIKRAAAKIEKLIQVRGNDTALEYAVAQGVIPAYFLTAEERLKQLETTVDALSIDPALIRVGGGTDLYVQKHDTIKDASIRFMNDDPSMKGIEMDSNRCVIGAAATVTDLRESSILQAHFPLLHAHTKLVSSTPIRNMATVAGNLVNASPIGDLTVFFLALDAQLVLSDGKNARTLPLDLFYKGYKDLDKTPDEWITQISFPLPDNDTKFNFEKVSKRTYLDIASVNSACRLQLDGDTIVDARISAGGVGPTPLLLRAASAWLKGRTVSPGLVHELAERAQSELSPISDARGTAAYKRLLLAQLIRAHFLQCFPGLEAEALLHLPSTN